MAFPVFFDTCSIYGAGLSDLLLTLAERDVYRPLWSADVLAELRRVLLEAGITRDAVDHRISAMNDAFPDAVVSDYESLLPQMTCDANDRHVLAAAVRGGAEVVVTFNLKHFPSASLSMWNLSVVPPDDFLLDQLDLYPDSVIDAVTQVPASYEKPPVTTSEFLGLLECSGVQRFAQTVRSLV